MIGNKGTPINVEIKDYEPIRPDGKESIVPIGHYGTPADLKGTVVLLASAASDYVSGVTIPVDGGFPGR